MRTITVKATQGKKKGSFTSSAETFGEIKQELIDNGFSYSESLQVVVQSTQSALLTDGSAIPAGDQVLFMMPKETKSGWVPSGFSSDECLEDESTEDLIERKREIACEYAAIEAELETRLHSGSISVASSVTEDRDDLDDEFEAMQRALGVR